MTALLRIRHGAEGLALSPVDAAPDGIAQYARRHKVRRQNLVLFHFQTPEGRKTGIAFVPHAGARTFVKVFPAVGAQPLAIRLAQRTYRKGEHKLFPEQAGQIDLRRAVHQLDDELVGLAVERLFSLPLRGSISSSACGNGSKLSKLLSMIRWASSAQRLQGTTTSPFRLPRTRQPSSWGRSVTVPTRGWTTRQSIPHSVMGTDQMAGSSITNVFPSRGDVVQCNP